MKKIPASSPGMVARAVEESCRKSGLDRVNRRRARPDPLANADPKIFGELPPQ